MAKCGLFLLHAMEQGALAGAQAIGASIAIVKIGRYRQDSFGSALDDEEAVACMLRQTGDRASLKVETAAVNSNITISGSMNRLAIFSTRRRRGVGATVLGPNLVSRRAASALLNPAVVLSSWR